ncbi:DoxX family membrane protein [Bacillus sp. RHFB]|nr:DoxX family membrane protein [Bacillus sp. RHFB]
MNKVLLHLSRTLLGLTFLIAGLNGYFVIFDFEPFIATSPEAMALFKFEYLLIFEKFLEIVCGVLLLSNRFVPLALAILSPIIANIFFLHLFLDHSLLVLAVILVIMYSYLFFCYRKSFKSILEKKPFH